jgi:hypothetical protein
VEEKYTNCLETGYQAIRNQRRSKNVRKPATNENNKCNHLVLCRAAQLASYLKTSCQSIVSYTYQ